MIRTLLLAAFCSLSLSAQAMPPLPAWQSPEGREHEQLGVILDLHSGQVLSAEALLERLAAAPRVLIGEQHDNPDHHALQLWLLQALAERRATGAVLLEMLNPDQQAAVERVQQADRLPEDLPAALAWQKGWDWSLYGDLLRWSLQQPAPLLAANLDRNEITEIYKTRPGLEGHLSTAKPLQARMTEQIKTSHCGLLPDSQLPAMLRVQQHRDRRMAERLLAAPAPAILLAGNYHVRRDFGVPLHVADLAPEQRLQVLVLAEAGSSLPAEAADYIWYTAAQPSKDHCASLRK